MVYNHEHMPKSIGIILDGNRRYARQRGLPTLEGHRRGFEALKVIAKHASQIGLKHMAVYAFSTENWNRSEDEVSYLMDLFREVLQSTTSELEKESIRIKIVGQKDRFAQDIQELIKQAEDNTRENTAMTLWIALSYGGRAEITQAAQSAVATKKPISSESDFKHFLWSADLPDLDIVIRTGGERRLSNFFLWHSAYAELFFLDKYWPEFEPEDLDAVLREYAQRDRRMGK